MAASLYDESFGEPSGVTIPTALIEGKSSGDRKHLIPSLLQCQEQQCARQLPVLTQRPSEVPCSIAGKTQTYVRSIFGAWYCRQESLGQ